MNKLFRNRQNSGITLVALVVTIIVLIILAGITISILLEKNGILRKATEAKVITKEAKELEDRIMTNLTDWCDAKIDFGQESVEMDNDSLTGQIYKIAQSGTYNIEINKERYSVDAIVINKDIVLDGINEIQGATLLDNIYEFGNKEQDVATEKQDAQNMVVLKIKGDLVVKDNVTLTSCKSDVGLGGPKGLFIYCSGTIINEGTISMTARGAKCEGQDVFLWKNSDESYEFIPASGANGGEGVICTKSNYTQKIENYYLTKGKNGNSGDNRATGGGGSGGARTNSGKATSGNGGNGTSFSGGTGGGGTATYSQTTKGTAGSPLGGAGGNAISLRNRNTRRICCRGWFWKFIRIRICKWKK